MTKIFSVVMAIALVGIITVAGTATASAKGKHKQQIEFNATLAVVDILGLETNEHSGWSTIELETLAGVGLVNLVEGPAELTNLYLSAAQSSHEQFTSDFLPAANVKKGKSKGTFYLSVPEFVYNPDLDMIVPVPGETLVVGKYDLKVSSTVECQIYGKGKWKSKAKNSIIDGKGSISVCTNFVPAFGTFVTNVSVTGDAALAD